MENQSNETQTLNEVIRALNQLCSACEAQVKVSEVESILLRLKRKHARKLLDSLHQVKLYEVPTTTI